jgi:CRP-like cAMP-binding protein
MRKPTPDELRKLKDKAAEAAAKGKLEKAAELYREAADGDPRDVGTRQKLAEVLRRAGRTADAVQAYREVADRFGKDGLLIKAIAISKTILELDPRHVETQAGLAELYARKAAAEGARPPPRTMMVQALRGGGAAPARPAPAGGRSPTDAVVAIPLGAPPARTAGDAEAIPLELLVEPGPLPPPDPGSATVSSAPAGPGAEPTTAFQEIVFAAAEAAEAGLDEDLLVELDPEDVEVTGDEPLGPPPSPAAPSAAPAVQAPPPPPPRAPAPPKVAAPVRPPPAAAPPPAGPRLPRVPIFSDLSRDAFLALTAGMVLQRVSEGAAVIREGDDGTSFYVVASGRFAVTKRDDAGGTVVLARLGEGDFFGEMALLSGTVRSATVRAEEDGEVLELRADVLLRIARQHPHLAQSLRRFYRQRLLANAMAVSPIFRPFPRGDRKLLMEKFRAREVARGETVIREGDPSDGLYVVLEGAVDVRKRKDGQQVVVGHLREGDLFGEMSCLRKAPATATVVVSRPGTLLRLPRRAFDELVVTHPQILELVATLSEERAESLDAILSGHAQWTDEGLVLC